MPARQAFGRGKNSIPASVWVEGVVMLPVRHCEPGGYIVAYKEVDCATNGAVSRSAEPAGIEVHSGRPIHTESSQSLFVDIQTDTGIQRRLNLAALDSEHLLACEDPKRGRPLLFRQQRESDKS